MYFHNHKVILSKRLLGKFEPCKECLVKPCCSAICKEAEKEAQYFINNLFKIDNSIVEMEV